MTIILFNDACLYNENKTIIYGQYTTKFTAIKINLELSYKVIFYSARPDFYIEVDGKINNINKIIFMNGENILLLKECIDLHFPFENCNLSLKPNSAIISTMCKDYSSRLEEWIEYNLNLGFSGIVIFDNDGNKKNKINEPLENRVNNGSISDICKKYKGKVWCVKFNYQPINKIYDTVQRIALHIGVNAFRNKCEKIALIDADEFIYIPNYSNIENFLSKYKGQTLTIKSNILTNKSNNDQINNNILDICLYVGQNKYTKTIIDTSQIKPMAFIKTPHTHKTQIIMDKSEIIHYHCWVNSRYQYNINMPKMKFLKNSKYNN